MTADDKLSTGSLQTTRVQQDNCLGVIVDNDKYRDLILFSTDGTPVNQNIELGGYYKSADGNSYVFNDTKVLANFNTYEVIRLEAITANRAPLLDPIGDKSILEGNTLQFTISANDPDKDPLTYSAPNLPPGANFDPITRTFSWAPTESQIGTYTNIRFEVSDGKLTTTEDIIITVIGENSLSSAWWFWLILGMAIAVLTLVFVLWRRAVSNAKFP
jgi:hypothetical protein